MPREIKFRAWDKKTGKMYRVMDLKSGDVGNFWIVPSRIDYRGMDNAWDCGPGERCELMQYTGLKDKNGKEIYEGDVVEEYYQCDDDTNSGIIVWEDTKAAFHIKFSDSESLEIDPDKELEVIGNIYENKELKP